MELYEKYPIDHKPLQQGLSEWLDRWEWELFITLHFLRPTSIKFAIKDSESYLDKIRERYSRIKFAGFIQIANPNNTNPHAHILLISDPFYPLRLCNLPSIDQIRLQLYWENEFEGGKGSCLIESVTYPYGVTDYTASERNYPSSKPDQWSFSVYRKRVLFSLTKKKIQSRAEERYRLKRQRDLEISCPMES